MLKIKKIHSYIIKNFLRVFSLTFGGSLFVLLLQFLFQYVDALVGKGIETIVFAKLLFYASLTLIPLALPLSILLGSLITFGNLGERLELLSMKAAGISLWKIMRPLIILVTCISIAGFYFSNNILPKTQVKMWTLMFSIREKTPELDIPEGAFYNQIPGRNIYVQKKDQKHNLLKGIVIYDFSNGFSNTSIIAADSGKIRFSEDKNFLLLTLYQGETFENLKTKSANTDAGNKRVIPYRRETFRQKEILIDFNANFNLLSSDFLKNQYVSKNAAELQESIDSLTIKMNNQKMKYSSDFLRVKYFNSYNGSGPAFSINDSVKVADFNIDSKFYSLKQPEMQQTTNIALNRANIIKNDLSFNESIVDAQEFEIRRHGIEWYKKFTLSFACIIFFFVGAPLGAIIRKGGMGLPVVISTILFIIYYIFENTGYKMAREGVWPVGLGMWLSSMVLLPLGVFLTYKAVTDSVIMSTDVYIKTFQKIFKKDFLFPKKNKNK